LLRHSRRIAGQLSPYWLLLALGLANAALYVQLLPLWEGFDEPFHYGFLEHVAVRGALPVFGRTHLARDVEESLRLAPASPPVRRNLPYVMTYSEYFALPAGERAARRQALWNIPSAWRELSAPVANMNYEAQQAPLAYLALAPLDGLWADRTLAVRVLRLRLVCGVAAVLLCFAAGLCLARTLEMDVAAASLMLLLLFSAQMFYGATAHVANDWLAVSLAAWFLVALARYVRAPAAGAALWLGVAAGLGLLAKAYFLAFAAVAALAVLAQLLRRRARAAEVLPFALSVLALAAPWFARNLAEYGSLSVMQQTMRGVTFSAAAAAALHLPWAETAAAQLRAALWPGNSRFTTFSRTSLNAILLLLAAALLTWLLTLRAARHGRLERWIALACGVFLLALAYACAVFHAYGGGSPHLMPWQTAPLFLPLACLAAGGLRRAGAGGRYLAIALAAGFAYLDAATYVVKLIPAYAGCVTGRAGWRELHACYVSAGDRTLPLLADTALGPAWLVMALAAVVPVLVIAATTVTVRRWFGGTAR